jgi:hypothetical protein
MISDYQILGIDKTNDIDVIKTAFRKRAKEVHPDNTKEEDQIKNHLLFIQINQAYRRLLGEVALVEKRTNTRVESINNKTDLINHRDPAYVYYKMGMSILMKIHPREWNKEDSLLPTRSLKNNENDRVDQLKVVKELFSQFPRAYHYFSTVVHEYPDSLWVYDAMEKMKTIEDRTKQYLKIIESFSK